MAYRKISIIKRPGFKRLIGWAYLRGRGKLGVLYYITVEILRFKMLGLHIFEGDIACEEIYIYLGVYKNTTWYVVREGVVSQEFCDCDQGSFYLVFFFSEQRGA